jgi:hypothetical protein
MNFVPAPSLPVLNQYNIMQQAAGCKMKPSGAGFSPTNCLADSFNGI